MARTITHGAIVYRVYSADETPLWRIGKITDGILDYGMNTTAVYNAYHCAMDMARDNGNNVFIAQENADAFKLHGCDVSSEWVITPFSENVMLHIK
jgi:hypothetical protein